MCICTANTENAKGSQSSGSGQKSQGKRAKKAADKVVVINEEKIDLLLDMIKGADVTSEENKAENDTLLELEGAESVLLVNFDVPKAMLQRDFLPF